MPTDTPFTIASGYQMLTSEDQSTGSYTGPKHITTKVMKLSSQVRAITEDEEDYFSQPVAGSPGEMAQYFFRGPKYTNIDASFFKNFRLPWLGEQGRLQFRAEFFNLLNHTSFGNPNGTMSSSNFGVITSDNGSPRIGQFALKLYF